MKILGVTLSYNSTAALLSEGKVLSCVNEERFTRRKNETGYPKEAIEYCLSATGTAPRNLDWIALASFDVDPQRFIVKRECTFSVEDYLREQHEYWYPLFYKGEKPDYLKIFSDKVDLTQYPERFSEVDFSSNKRVQEFVRFRVKMIANHLGIPEEKVVVVNHHKAHGYYAYYGSPFRDQDVLVLTADGFGDGANATVRVVKKGRMEHLSTSSNCDVGRIYRYATLLLGMKPGEEEYKVMGLAPYATSFVSKRPFKIFRETLRPKGMQFEYLEKPNDLYFSFKKLLDGCRFDGIAGGLQRFTEEILSQWVLNCIEETGIRTVVFSGGVSNNVKAMMKLASLPAVEAFFVCPSGGDESLAIGAAYALCDEKMRAEGRNPAAIPPLTSVYLGPSVTWKDMEMVLKDAKPKFRYEILEDPSAKNTAKFLKEGRVLGRCSGPMEFGVRALGNRSILANPSSSSMIKKVNRKIKQRDFWMPFAPTILNERAKKYLVNPKELSSPFMTLAFRTTERAQSELSAALHPADFTARPQILKREENPEYYDLISAFERETGIGALLNTSLNLHGEPIVCTAQDALYVLEESELDGLMVDHHLLLKKT